MGELLELTVASRVALELPPNPFTGRTRRASDFQIAVLAANLINRKILIDAVPGMSPHNPLGIFLSTSSSNPKS